MTDASHATEQTRGHQFDGIEEFDNRLPNWWLWSFYLACIFSVGYWIHYHTLGTGALPADELRLENEAAAASLVQGEVTEESLAKLAAEPSALAAGKDVFAVNCVACHMASGAGIPGSVGPNLTDKYWLHGGSPMDIYTTITKGVIAKGMIAWEPVLGPTRCKQVTAYLLSMKNTNVPGGKEPQGEPEEE